MCSGHPFLCGKGGWGQIRGLRHYLERDGNLLRAKEAIEHRLTGVDAQIMATIKSGTQVDGLALDNPPGRLKWIKPEKEILALGDLMQIELGKRSLITPTQAIKLLDESVIKVYSDRPIGKTKIVDSKTTRAAMVFGK